MKNLILVICVMLAGWGTPHAQTTLNRASNNYIPFHQHFKQSNTVPQNSSGGAKSIATIDNEIAYRHDVWNTGSWAFYDSANYAYNALGGETGGILCTYSTANSNWANDTINTYTYDQAGNLLTQLTQNWDAVNNCWVNKAGLATSYNSANKPLSKSYKIFVANKYWQNTTNYVYTYDANNYQVGEVDQIWNYATVSWLNVQQLTQTIGSNNLMSVQEVHYWDSSSATWANRTHTIYTYDNRNNQTSWIEQVWQSSQWINFYKDSFVFDHNNNLTAVVYQQWDTLQLSWVNKYQSLYTYDANNNLTQYASYKWNANNAVWTPVFLDAYLYTAANKVLTETSVDWNLTTNTYELTYQGRYTYDGNNNLTEFASYYWGYQGAWVPNTLFSYTIDGNNKTIYELDQVYDPATSTMVNSDQYFYYYSIDASTGIHAPQNDLGAALYPNPTSGNNIHIALSLNQGTDITLNTYDEKGQLISTSQRSANTGANNLQINYPALSSGTYFIQVIDHNSKAASVLKFVKN